MAIRTKIATRSTRRRTPACLQANRVTAQVGGKHHANTLARDMEIVNAFTIDVEEHFQVSAFEAAIPREQWDGFPSRVVANTRRLLALLERHAVKATFFVLGWTAKRHPALSAKSRPPATKLLRTVSGTAWFTINRPPSSARRPAGSRRFAGYSSATASRRYRAPSFSITRRSLWAREILVEEGFDVDSSVFPIHHDRYGIPDAALAIHRVDTPAGPLWEFPPSVVRAWAGCGCRWAGAATFAFTR